MVEFVDCVTFVLEQSCINIRVKCEYKLFQAELFSLN